MLRSIKRKTEAAFRRRKASKSVDHQVTPVDIDWPLQTDSYPPSSSTGEQTASTTTNTTEAEEEPRPAEEEEEDQVPLQVKQENTASVTETTAVEEIPFEEEPTQEVAESEEEPGMDSFAPKYVPFVETSAMRSNRFVNPASSHYGTVNPAIMSGFGDDDDSIWLVDDEESDEEAKNAKKTTKGKEVEEEEDEEEEEEEEDDEGEEGQVKKEVKDEKKKENKYEEEEEDEEDEEGEEEEEDEEDEQEGKQTKDTQQEIEEEHEAEPDDAVSITNEPPPAYTEPETAPTDTTQAPSGFRYRINLALFDDDDFITAVEETKQQVSLTTDEVSLSQPPSPTVDIRNNTMEFLRAANASRQPRGGGGGQDETATSNGTSTPATSNPYVDLLEQQDSAMTVAYQRRLDLSGRRGDEEADDFR